MPKEPTIMDFDGPEVRAQVVVLLPYAAVLMNLRDFFHVGSLILKVDGPYFPPLVLRWLDLEPPSLS